MIGFSDRDINKAIGILNQMPKEIKHPTISAAASKALLPAKNNAKQKVAEISTGETNKAIQLVRNVKVKRNKPKQAPGAKLWIDGPDVYVDNRYWTARGFAKLLAMGAENRSQKSTGRFTGDFKGYGNFIHDAARESITAIHARFKAFLIKDFRRAKKRAIAKNGG